MTDIHLYVRCSRCGARAFLYTITPAMLDHPPAAPLDPEPAQVWMQAHEDAVHGQGAPGQREIERWLMGYRKALPRFYELVEEAEEG